MPTLKSLDNETAQGRTKELFQAVEKRTGRIPAMIRIMGNSPSMLDAYLHFNEVFGESKLVPKLRSLISATVSEINGCDYTLSTAFAFGRREGLSDEELTAARSADNNDPKIAAALRFAAKTVNAHGSVAPADVKELQVAGYSDQEIVEIVGIVALNILRNYMNLIAKTETDFPLVRTRRSTELIEAMK